MLLAASLSLFTPLEQYHFSQDTTTVIVLRHGENEANKLRKYDGRTLNMSLTEEGRDQATEAAQLLKSRGLKRIDAVLISPLKRTRETAETVLEEFGETGVPITEDEGIYERSLGDFEGKSLTDPGYLDFREKELEVLDDPNVSFEKKMAFKPVSNIESIGEVYKRAISSLQNFAEKNKGKTVLAVTHSGTIRSLFWEQLAKDHNQFLNYKQFKPENGSMLVFELKDGELKLKAIHRII